ncbi:MAG: 16S rRNA (cytosine(1402)-N(4))-methyltransferase RsmH [Syntrophobacterales bacterium]|nr:MAG: 16S rRNA (cytosine(1402)-N(4))-methyltransferase RsmH [Syntrophobacterales bacterium]
MAYEHFPVLIEQVTELLDPHPNGIYVDCTVGGAGHALEILERSSPTGRLVGIDRDGEAIEEASKRLKPYEARTTLIHGNFSDLREILRELNIGRVDGIVMDLGVSYQQLIDERRGFSFQSEGPLDMRMDQTQGEPASKLINTLSRGELEGILRRYGEGRWARKIAKAIVRHRQKTPIVTTTQLRDIISSAVLKPPRRIHPATRTFQAIRITINDELNNLERGIRNGIPLLKSGGRLCIISFHSLEDRIVKETFRQYERTHGVITIITKKPISPSKGEISENPRARSAKLRVAERV